MNTSRLPRQLATFGVVIPLALLLGYLIATPTRFTTVAIVGLVLFVLCIPLLLQFHYPLLLFSWNTIFIVVFLPGKPSLWMVMAGLSLGIAVLTKVMNKEAIFQNVPSITAPLLFLVAVVLITAKLTGGIGLQSLGGDKYGGKKVVFILAAVIGYFAISNFRIPPDKVHRYTGLFYISGLTGIIPNLLYMAGPVAWSLFVFFPVDFALFQAVDDFGMGATGVRFSRLTGLTFGGLAALAFMLMRFGLRGILDLRKPWRLGVVTVIFGLSLLGGFRSGVITFALMCSIQFWFEGLHRTRLLPAALISIVIGFCLLIPLTPHLPLSVQRSLSVFPLPIDAAARSDAQASTQWRLEMWQVLVDEIPKYLLIGKGYAIDPTDLYFAGQAVRRGIAGPHDAAVLSGDYHSGPLSVMIPFGIFGVLGFLWFIFASIRLLYRNHRFSDPALQGINTFLLAYFLARFTFFIIGAGAFHSDLPLFTGIVALSIAVNGAVRRTESTAAALPQLTPVPTAA